MTSFDCNICGEEIDGTCRGYRRCLSCYRLMRKKHYTKHKEKYIESATKWAQANRHKSNRIKLASRDWNTRATNKCRCCTKEELSAFYQTVPPEMHIDHIVPIFKGGLHCLNNLQALTPSEHYKKNVEERRRT